MAEKKKFLLRIDEKLYAALEHWAADDLRSINAQIEFILSNALKKAGRQSLVRSGTDDSNNKQKK